MTSFASCSDDDDKLPVDQFKTSIVGTWEVKHAKGWGIEEGVRESWDEKVEAGWLYTLESDGTGYETEDDYDYEFDWTITNTKLTLTYSKYYKDEYTIKQMTKDKIVLYESEEEYENTITLERKK